jgi:hypothetical protein
MHTDRKIGFAMGILLIGVVAAMFFRNEPLLNPDAPTVRREQELNDGLRERNVAVYLNDGDTKDASKNDDRQRWTLKEVLDNMGLETRASRHLSGLSLTKSQPLIRGSLRQFLPMMRLPFLPAV